MNSGIFRSFRSLSFVFVGVWLAGSLPHVTAQGIGVPGLGAPGVGVPGLNMPQRQVISNAGGGVSAPGQMNPRIGGSANQRGQTSSITAAVRPQSASNQMMNNLPRTVGGVAASSRNMANRRTGAGLATGRQAMGTVVPGLGNVGRRSR
jgi:hypothetical protein